MPDLPDLGDRVMVLVGTGDHHSGAIVEAAASLGAVAAATVTSGCRGSGAIARYHHLLVDGVPPGLEPTGVIVAGRINPAERLLGMTTTGAPVVHVDTWGIHSDPAGTMTVGVTGDPVGIVAMIGQQDGSWADLWAQTESAVEEAVTESLLASEDLSGPLIAESLNHLSWGTLVVGSSLPIRDADAHVVRGGSVFANRGVSGIDGFSSTYLGIAANRDRALAFVGDLSFLHDSNAFLTDRIPDGVMVVVDNDGGGLFDLLPQSRLAPNFARFFVTPHGRDLAELAAFHGLDFADATTPQDLVSTVEREMDRPGMCIVRAKVDRGRDLSMRMGLDRTAREVLVERFGPDLATVNP